MKFTKVAAVAIEALEARRKVFAPEANMYKRGMVVSPATERVAARYAELTEAIEELKDLAKAGRE